MSTLACMYTSTHPTYRWTYIDTCLPHTYFILKKENGIGKSSKQAKGENIRPSTGRSPQM